MPKSWGYTFMINDHDAPTGRPAGELGWAGLANLYYWIDRKNGLEVSGRPRYSRSPTLSRSPATWTSRRRSTKTPSRQLKTARVSTSARNPRAEACRELLAAPSRVPAKMRTLRLES